MSYDFCASCGLGPDQISEICSQCGQNQLVFFEDLLSGLQWRRRYEQLREKANGNALSYNHKMWRKMAFDRNPLQQQFADKFRIRDYVSEKVGSKYLSQIFSVANRTEDFPWESLPTEYALKVNHGSGGSILVDSGTDPTIELPETVPPHDWSRFHIHPDQAKLSRMIIIANTWLSQNFTTRPDMTPEWAYHAIKPLLYAEELLKSNDGQLPWEFNIYVFHGVAQYFRVRAHDVMETKKTAHLDRNWNNLAISFKVINEFLPMDPPPPMPENLTEMLWFAEELSSEIDAVRVDFYLVDGEIIFGELTNYQNAGVGLWHPEEFNFQISATWNQKY